MKRRKTALFWIILAAALAFAGFAGWILLSNMFLKNSPEFTSSVLHYAFVNKEKGVAYFVRIDTTKRMVYIVTLKQHYFDPVNSRALDLSNPLDVFSFVERMFDISSSQRFFASLTDKQLKEFMNSFFKNGSNDFPVFLTNLASKKAGIFDNMLLGRRLNVLRPESNFTKASLAKFVYELRRNALRFYTLTTVIDKPVRIYVDGRQYERIYLDPKSIELIREDLRR
ncbi:hypothetical protein [Pseudothermotoga thermarum]|uniref:Uncharacterized protein n=1 Tax=Pseudothermotoga thermarum DSM 5069 TaxID=688269 RepID=F7YXM4_9THEM|nr:hypothetical protein [Pseudothermotoga thermarum]AEH50666.1 hypothetical protein Theth_0578 [Pseudothermotoga thermarum DSM 5069]